MKYYIVGIQNGHECLGTQFQALKECRYLNRTNVFKYFIKSLQNKKIEAFRVYSYTNLYDEKTHKLIKEYS